MRNVPNTSKIIVLQLSNPKKGMAKDRYDIYLKNHNITIEEFLKLGGRAADIKWDLEHGFINLKDGETTLTH